jgi:hypothetical protein
MFQVIDGMTEVVKQNENRVSADDDEDDDDGDDEGITTGQKLEPLNPNGYM